MKELYSYQREISNNDLIFRIKLNPKHKIFQGHFPNNPILPGVCQVQIIKELLLTEYSEYSCIVSSKAIKFLHVINPNETETFDVNFKIIDEKDNLKVIANIYDEKHTYLKMDMITAKHYAQPK